MSTVNLSKTAPLEVATPDGNLFLIWAGEYGGVYLESVGKGSLLVSICDDDDASVEAVGNWLTAKINRIEEG